MSGKKKDKPMEDHEFDQIMEKLEDPEELQKALGKLLEIVKKEKKKAKTKPRSPLA